MSVFVGVDQTGALNSQGFPRPLPACRLEGSRFEFGHLKEFSKSEVSTFAANDSATLILDCVLGLPIELKMDWRHALFLLKSENRFGRNAAEEFFLKLGRGQIWHRDVERLAKANSLFRSRPFQRNIQTGTYRFWLEMARDPDWFSVPWLEPQRKSKFRVYEGYPSLLWRRLLAVTNRKPQEISTLTQKHFGLKWSSQQVQLVEKDCNFADALILALGGRHLLAETKSIRVNREGWILGVRLPVIDQS
jgi:hypothetical protein